MAVGGAFLTTPFWLFMQLILILDINFKVGGSSGYRPLHSTFSEYILFSYGVWKEEETLVTSIISQVLLLLTLGGPIIIPVQ